MKYKKDKVRSPEVQKSIEHWERMIRWASIRDSHQTPCLFTMELELKESWRGGHCALCLEYAACKSNPCAECPLKLKYGSCDTNTVRSIWHGPFHVARRCENRWAYVMAARTWKKWIKEAKKFLIQLYSL